MTSNVGAKKLQDFGSGVGFKTGTSTYADEEYKRDVLKKELKKFFTPEFLNRIDEVVIFNSLVKEDVKKIVKLELDKLSKRLVGLKYDITFDESILELISEVGFDEPTGLDQSKELSKIRLKILYLKRLSKEIWWKVFHTPLYL
jgi:ATP-dependent Clp protease ATP-binding subunit ClpC